MHKWNWSNKGRVRQVMIDSAEDIACLGELDEKAWTVLSMGTGEVRFDSRLLELIDLDHDKRIRIDEIVAAIDFLKSHNVELNDLFGDGVEDKKKLDDLTAMQNALEQLPVEGEDKEKLEAWIAKGSEKEIAILGDETAAANAALADVEALIDGWFLPPEETAIVCKEPIAPLPLNERLNPRYADKIEAFKKKCLESFALGEIKELDLATWKELKSRFAAYRAYIASKPVANAGKKRELEEEEKILRCKIGLLELLENFVNMKRLYEGKSEAIFIVGTLRIAGRELKLCFDVPNEGAHSALSGKSNCFVVYAKLTRCSDKATRNICAVVTSGKVSPLYVGRNGVFTDRDGNHWEATITKTVENQVSLAEAFWMPWRKLGEGIASTVKKFFGDSQSQAMNMTEKATKDSSSASAALASSVAAIGIGIGVAGAAFSALLATVRSMSPWMLALAVVMLVLIVSVPSVILAWFKLRKRDIGAILNAGGWALNRPLRLTAKTSREFTEIL